MWAGKDPQDRVQPVTDSHIVTQPRVLSAMSSVPLNTFRGGDFIISQAAPLKTLFKKQFLLVSSLLMKVGSLLSQSCLVSQSHPGELWLSCQELVALPHNSQPLTGAAGLMVGTFFWLSFGIPCECSQCLPGSALGSLGGTEQLTLPSCWIGHPSFPTPLW